MNRKFHWSERDDSILKEEVSKSPELLANAFRQTSKRLKNKSFKSCMGRWYNVVRKQEKVFSLESDNSSVVNTKNGINNNLNLVFLIRILVKKNY